MHSAHAVVGSEFFFPQVETTARVNAAAIVAAATDEIARLARAPGTEATKDHSS